MASVDLVKRWLLSPDGSNDGREVLVKIPLQTVSETNIRELWFARHRRRKQQRQTVGLILSGIVKAEGIIIPCAVRLTRVGPTSGLDSDNLVSSMKSIRDGVADALGVDDASPRVTWSYEQRRESKWGVEISIKRYPASVCERPTKGKKR